MQAVLEALKWLNTEFHPCHKTDTHVARRQSSAAAAAYAFGPGESDGAGGQSRSTRNPVVRAAVSSASHTVASIATASMQPSLLPAAAVAAGASAGVLPAPCARAFSVPRARCEGGGCAVRLRPRRATGPRPSERTE